MSGSLSQKNGSPPYFYFRFGGYSPRHGPFWPIWPTCTSLGVQVTRPLHITYLWPLESTPPGMPGTQPPIFWLGGGRQREYPPILLRTFGYYSRPILVALRSLSLKPISFGYKTPPIRFSQAGGQSAHEARPPNLELALTPLGHGKPVGR